MPDLKDSIHEDVFAAAVASLSKKSSSSSSGDASQPRGASAIAGGAESTNESISLFRMDPRSPSPAAAELSSNQQSLNHFMQQASAQKFVEQQQQQQQQLSSRPWNQEQVTATNPLQQPAGEAHHRFLLEQQALQIQQTLQRVQQQQQLLQGNSTTTVGGDRTMQTAGQTSTTTGDFAETSALERSSWLLQQRQQLLAQLEGLGAVRPDTSNNQAAAGTNIGDPLLLRQQQQVFTPSATQPPTASATLASFDTNATATASASGQVAPLPTILSPQAARQLQENLRTLQRKLDPNDMSWFVQAFK